ncbi:carbohydrate-binding protein [Actinotalea fermentans]|uniref:Chitin-binding type-3 domain-containing protein n=1 Tax=Actinotalea fermentans TaxID=43671 RepID=A0A511YX53_9CELL|nr:carbohydrate-binding protein [Actinotalea fermentans]GEN79759.1 hypothetical protein AFE02nite_14930 [Actinotalea fermentans]
MTSPSSQRTRVSPWRLLVVLALVGGLGWTGTRTVAAIVAPTPDPGDSRFAAYVDVTATPAFAFETPSGPAQSTVALSFVVADPQSPCTPTWGGYYGLQDAADVLELDRRIAQLRATGGDVWVSFGGQLGTELSAACSDPDALRTAYRDVIDRYDLSRVDLDIEGTALEDEAGAARRAAAFKDLQDEAADAGRSLDVWLTLPVGPDGLTDRGVTTVETFLAAGVDVGGVNGMTMNFGVVTSPHEPLADVVVSAAEALRDQVADAFADAGRRMSTSDSWARVGVTPMIGQSDVQSERFTLADAAAVNAFAKDRGLGLVSMWSLNRDATCTAPLPSVLTVVQTGCSGVDQRGESFAETLAADLDLQPVTPDPAGTARSTPTPTATAASPADVVDDPETSPYPIWDPYGTYPAGTKIVWHKQVYQARFWTSGVVPGTPVANEWDSPWTLIGPVLPGDRPAPLPTLPAGTYPDWDADGVYVAGDRVLLDGVPYEAKWWSQGQEPGTPVPGGSPWVLVIPAG